MDDQQTVKCDYVKWAVNRHVRSRGRRTSYIIRGEHNTILRVRVDAFFIPQGRVCMKRLKQMSTVTVETKSAS